MNEIDIFDMHASFCGIFASPIRLKIMWMLGDGEKTVSEIANELDISIPNVSQHLRIMRTQGAVLTKRDGRAVYYTIANSKFLQSARLIRQGIMEEIEKKGLLLPFNKFSLARSLKR
jgi:ArsR family transcriptional regulator